MSLQVELLPVFPCLQVQHSPGWQFEQSDPRDPHCVTVFRSNRDMFGYTVDLFTDTGEIYTDLSPTGDYYDQLTPTDLMSLANQASLCQQWLTDLANVTAWIRDHKQEIVNAALADTVS